MVVLFYTSHLAAIKVRFLLQIVRISVIKMEHSHRLSVVLHAALRIDLDLKNFFDIFCLKKLPKNI